MQIPKPKQLMVSFGKFWWEFLIGENPDAFIGTLAIVAAALLLRHNRPAAAVVLPVIAVVFLLGSSYRARIRARQ